MALQWPSLAYACSTTDLLMPTQDELNQAMLSGISFRKAPKQQSEDTGKVKTKAKKKNYITGAHGSGSAKQKAKIRQRRANRSKK